MAFALVLLGGAIAGGVLYPLTRPAAFGGLGFLLVVRPMAGTIGPIGSKNSSAEKMVISFFGIDPSSPGRSSRRSSSTLDRTPRGHSGDRMKWTLAVSLIAQ